MRLPLLWIVVVVYPSLNRVGLLQLLTVLNPEEPFEEFTTATAYAIRCSHHQRLGATPAQLIFGRDMIPPTQYIANWEEILRSKQMKIADSNKRENNKNLPHEYNVGDIITLSRPGTIRKLSIPRRCPYPIEQLHNNGSVTIKLRPYVTDRVNIRRVQSSHTLSKMEKKNKICIPTCILLWWQTSGSGSSMHSNLHSYVVAGRWQYIRENLITEVFQKYTRRPLQRDRK